MVYVGLRLFVPVFPATFFAGAFAAARFFAHIAVAALLASWARSSSVSFAMRAGPPSLPPFFPSSDMISLRISFLVTLSLMELSLCRFVTY